MRRGWDELLGHLSMLLLNTGLWSDMKFRDLDHYASTAANRAMERDRGLCTCPGCSMAADHVHHVVFRSHGGGDEEEKLTSLCQAHHLRGVHEGYVRVQGAAPDGLAWELGEARQ